MRKISLISLIVIISVIVFMAFKFNNNNNPVKQDDVVTFQLKGCTECNTPGFQIQYCIDGGPTITVPGSPECTFTYTCDPIGAAGHIICVTCGNKKGGGSFQCTDRVVVVRVSEGADCTCSDKKKNKK